MKKIIEGYKMTELGEIPNEWEVKKLKDIANICYGKSQKEIEVDNGKYKILGTGGIIGYTNDFLWNEPSVLIGRKGTIDKPQYIEEPFWTVDTLFYTKLTANYIAKWFYYYVDNIDLKKYNEATGVPSLSAANLNTISIATPTYEEQEKIASIISTVDEQIDNVNALVEKNKELKKGLIQTLLTKGIGHTKFKKTEIGEIPEEWEVKKLHEICNIKIGGTPSRNELLYWDSEKKYKNKWISIKDLSNCNKYIYDTNEYITELGINNSNVKKLEAKTVIMSFKLSIGKTAITTETMYTNEAIAAFTELNDIIYYEYLYYTIPFLKYDVDIAVKGSTLNKEKLNNTLLALPKYDEQIKIASILSEIDKKIEEYESKKQKLEEIKKGLMQKLLTGRIRV